MEDINREIENSDVVRGSRAERNSRNDRNEDDRGAVKFVAGFLAGFAACVAALAIMIYPAGLGKIIPEKDYEYYDELSTRYGKYYVIMNMIGEDPLVDTTPEEITDDYLKELISGLDDPYAEYFTAEEYKAFAKRFEGDYVGVGILLAETEEGFIIVQVYEDGPAYEAGIKEGDRIIRVDGTEPSDIDDAVGKMTGEAETKVTVTVIRDGEEIDFTMKRQSINIDSVGYFVSKDDPEIGYIRIALFAEDTDEEFMNAVKELTDKGCDKFIIDLRDNGGGMTDICISIADYLLPDCRIMTEVSKDGTEKEYKSEQSSADLDMVVLVNGNTASASEILTAAIQENNAGTVVGSRTYGKGVTQISRQFKDGSAVKLTVTEYLTPNGNHVQGKGITPDIETEDADAMDAAIEELKDQ